MSTELDATVSPLAALRSATGVAVVAATVLASAVATLDANVVKVAVPAIGRHLHAGTAAVQWTVTSYLLVVAALLLVAGSLADRVGRRRLVQVGLLIMLAASVLCGIAPSVGALIAARVAEGVGAALVVPNSLALLNAALDPADRARAIGIWAGLETLAATAGPYAGGWLVDNVSWRAIFFLNPPLIVAALAPLRRVPEPGTVASSRSSFDAVGSLLMTAGLGGVVYALTEGATSGWTSVPVLLALVGGAVALLLVIPVERRLRNPMLQTALFASRQFDAINMTTLLLYGALGAAGYVVVLQLELQLHYSASAAGAALIPQSAVFLVLAPVSGALVARLGPRRLMVAGIVIVAAGFVWLSVAHHGDGYVGSILPGAVLWGVGLGLAVSPLTAAVLAAVSDAQLGEASGVNDAAARIGGVVVVALVPALVGVTHGTTLAQALHHGYRPAMLVLAGVCAAAAVVTALFVTDDRPADPTSVPRMPPMPPHHSCALPVRPAER